MPAAAAYLLPLCLGLTLLGVIATGIAWRRGNRGRVIQGAALALAPIALYFTGLLQILWDFVAAIVGWASRIIFTPAVWFGLSLLGVCIVLFVVGGIVARRSAAKAVAAGGVPKAVARSAKPTTSSSAQPARGKAGPPPIDDEMAEIEALLKKRGIE
jgi:hypothetical protein